MAAPTAISVTPVRIFLDATRNKPAPNSTACRMRRISAASLTMRARSTSGGAERRRALPFSKEARLSRIPAGVKFHFKAPAGEGEERERTFFLAGTHPPAAHVGGFVNTA